MLSIRSTVDSRVCSASSKASSLTALREKTNIISRAAISNVAKAIITLRLSLKDKVLVIILGSLAITAANI